MTAKPVEVAVVGGGMGGLCVAIGLLKHKHLKVQVYEAAHRFSEIGAGVAFGPNAQRALKLIGDSTEQAYLRQATHNQWKEHKNTWFEFYIGQGERDGEHLVTPKNETGQSTVHRAKFLDEFVRLVPPEIAHFGKRLVRLEELSSGRIKLFFQDETTVEADCVIGAEGIHSHTRAYILGEGDPAIDPVFTGSVAYRALIPMEEACAAIGEQYAMNSCIWCGPGGAIMIYPIDFGATMNVVAINSTYKTWEGPWVQKAAYSKIEQDFQGWGDQAMKIIKLLDREDTSAWSMWDMDPAVTYCKGNVVMMGDAAHASTPYQGQGAGQAIEDAYVISSLLGLVETAEEAAYAFQAYDRIRRPRSQQVCKTSREMGELLAFRLPGVGSDTQLMRENISFRMDWMWHRDVDGERREGEIIFKDLKEGAKPKQS